MAQRKSQKQKFLLEKRLSAYSLAAASLLLGTQKADSTIHYTDIDPDAVLMENGEVFDVQFAGENKFQIRFNKSVRTQRNWISSRYTTTSTYWFYTPTYGGYNRYKGHSTPYSTTQTVTTNKVGVFPATGNAAFIGTAAYASALNGGATIGSSRSFAATGANSNMARYMEYPYSAGGNFRYTSNRYLGVRFQDMDGHTHYGWVQVSIPSYNADSATITGLAYEDMPGIGILAGEQDTSLPVALSAFSASAGSNGVRLEWTTESETNHAGFVLSRRVLDQDGNPASPWTEIAGYKTHDALRSSGNSSSKKDYSFVDVNAEGNTVYEYMLSDVDDRGKTTSQRLIRVDTQAVIPSEFSVRQNYPNPFNPETTIGFDLPENAAVLATVYDVRGRKVAVLADGVMQAGSHKLKWNAENQNAGTYFCEVKAGDDRGIVKLMLMR